MTRRDALRLLGLAGLSVAGCRSEADEEVGDDEAEVVGSRCGLGHEQDEGVARSAAACPPEFRKYEKIVILTMENRSFDHYFGHLSMPRELGGEGRTDVDGLKGNEIQFLTRDGRREEFKPFLARNYTLNDIDHEWDACHGQFNNGAVDGFIKKHFEDLERLKNGQKSECGPTAAKCGALGDPMAYFTRKDTPVFHQLIDNYALCDRWFSSVMGPTFPNRLFLYAATACGIKKSTMMDIASAPTSPNEARTIWHELGEKCISAVNYFVDFPFTLGAFGPNNTVLTKAVFGQSCGTSQLSVCASERSGRHGKPTYATTTFEEACELGCLPTVSIIDPAFFLAPCDDHPPHDIQAGQAFVAAIYKMMTRNVEQWSKTLFIITYDEHGSFYDHVAPPQVAEDERAEFRQLGFRVPALVVGPYVKKNYVSHVQYDHVSFLSTVTRRLDLTPLNRRVATANDIRDCIDRNAVETDGLATSPIGLKSVELSESKVHESIRDSLGQSELAKIALGGPASLEQKKRATDRLLGTFDRLGVANIRR